MKIIVLVITLIIQALNLVNAQPIAFEKNEQYADSFVNKLLAEGKDSIIVFSVNPIGGILYDYYTPDSVSSRPIYVFWKSRRMNYFKRFDIYYAYGEEKFGVDTFVDYINRNIDTVKRENIYNYKITSDDGLLKILPNHVVYYQTKFVTKTDSFIYSIPSTAIDRNNYFFESSVHKLIQIKILNYIQNSIRLINVRKLKKFRY